MSYEQESSLYIDIDACDLAEELQPEGIFLYGPMASGMRPLDYEPNTDDYEYMQSILY
ncbi:hypothetical protein SynPROS91_01146 [Synechococcus sp. PROS-9-1]|uniref:hypothetical protein n=1 Tax=Synechococcus sp. PROS-9-1 TaxID=1968775 RepID=UPI00164619C2|nr:hypothetical protein [Synechococcus sp. PROS-9-1]QNJ31524.1 hypothetical protein SynPROS91_01146 [Synechococcus sp. PROS-9-1]